MGEHLTKHGDGVRDIAFSVEDLDAIMERARQRGCKIVDDIWEESDENGTVSFNFNFCLNVNNPFTLSLTLVIKLLLTLKLVMTSLAQKGLKLVLDATFKLQPSVCRCCCPTRLRRRRPGRSWHLEVRLITS